MANGKGKGQGQKQNAPAGLRFEELKAHVGRAQTVSGNYEIPVSCRAMFDNKPHAHEKLFYKEDFQGASDAKQVETDDAGYLSFIFRETVGATVKDVNLEIFSKSASGIGKLAIKIPASAQPGSAPAPGSQPQTPAPNGQQVPNQACDQPLPTIAYVFLTVGLVLGFFLLRYTIHGADGFGAWILWALVALAGVGTYLVTERPTRKTTIRLAIAMAVFASLFAILLPSKSDNGGSDNGNQAPGAAIQKSDTRIYQPGEYTFSLKAGEMTDHWIAFPDGRKSHANFYYKKGSEYLRISEDGRIVGKDESLDGDFLKFKIKAECDSLVIMVVT